MTADGYGASISVVGDWTRIIAADDLSGGAGTDIAALIESNAYQGIVTVANTNGTAWALSIRRSGLPLPSGVSIAVKRNGGGSCGNLEGGGDYQSVGEFDQLFFSGVGDCNGIGIQLRFQGVSVLQPPGDYHTTVLYTLQ